MVEPTRVSSVGAVMNELEARVLRKRVFLTNHFSHPVIIEAATVHDTLVLA
jgi:hypothetical protein